MNSPARPLRFNALAEYRRTWLNRLGGEWLSQAQVGENTYLASEFYQPLDEAGRWFVTNLAKENRSAAATAQAASAIVGA